MTENIKPVTKNQNRAIPMSLSCNLDLSEYSNKEPQPYNSTVTKKQKKIHLYIHFEGMHPYCFLLKSPQFLNVPIFSIAFFSLKIYNSKFKTTFLAQDARYFLVNDITNSIKEIGLDDTFPPNLEPNTDFIIRLHQSSKEPYAVSNHLKRVKRITKSLVASTSNANSENNDDSSDKSQPKPNAIQVDSNNINPTDSTYDNSLNNLKQELSMITQNDRPINDNSNNANKISNNCNSGHGIIIDVCSIQTTHDELEATNLVQKGDFFSKIGDPKLASLFYWSAGLRGITSLVSLSKLSGELSIIDRTRFQLLTRFPNEVNKISTDKQKTPSSIEKAIEILSDPKKLLIVDSYVRQNDLKFNSKLTAAHPVNYKYIKKAAKKNQNQNTSNTYLDKLRAKELIKQISKDQPYIALKICLKYPEYTEFIPIPCRIEEVMDAFVQICVKQNYDNIMLFYFAELLSKNGLISRSMQIGYNISVLSALPECATRRACWVMLITRQFTNLFMLLETYFKRCQNRSIGFLSASIVYNNLMTVKKSNFKSKSSQRCVQTIVDPLDPADLDFLCIVLDTACFLFLSGYVEDFKDIQSAISTQNRKYFEKTGIPPEFDFYVFIDKAAQYAVNDRIPKDSIFALGDEGTLNNAYNTLFNFEMVIPHPIPRMTIYDLRKGKKNLRKAAFWQQIRDCTMFHQILLVLGHYDLLYSIPKLLQRDHTVMSFTDAVNKIIEIYLYVIEKVHRILPRMKIFIHPLVFRGNNLDNQKVVFNSSLKKVLPDYCKMLKEKDCAVLYDNSLMIK